MTSAPVPLHMSGISRSTRRALVFLARSRVYVELRAFEVGYLAGLFCMQFNNRLDGHDDAILSENLE